MITRNRVLALAVGIALGAGTGVAMDNLGVAPGIGQALGAAIMVLSIACLVALRLVRRSDVKEGRGGGGSG